MSVYYRVTIDTRVMPVECLVQLTPEQVRQLGRFRDRSLRIREDDCCSHGPGTNSSWCIRCLDPSIVDIDSLEDSYAGACGEINRDWIDEVFASIDRIHENETDESEEDESDEEKEEP